MLTAKAALKIAGDNLDSYSKTVDLSKARLNAGDISATDFDRIDLQLAEFEADNDSRKARPDPGQRSAAVAAGNCEADQAPSTSPARSILPLSLRPWSRLSSPRSPRAPTIRRRVQSVRVADASIKLADAEGTTDPTIGGEYERTGDLQQRGLSDIHPAARLRSQSGREGTHPL